MLRNKLNLLARYQRRNVWMLLFGSKWVVAGALIFNERGELLLIKHRWRGAWEYPAGASTGTESPLAAAKREVHEEVGLTPVNFQLLGVDFFHRRTPNGNLVFTFSATVDDQEAARLKLDPLEVMESRWVSRTQALQIISPRLRHRLYELLKAYDQRITVYLQTGHKLKD